MGERKSRRIPSLDGLRGAAALVVVLGHAQLIYMQNEPSERMSEPLFNRASQVLGILGNHAVWLFFVLSGLVLTRMMMTARHFDYGNYVLGRLARLYVPVWVAVLLTFVSMLVVGRREAGLGQWVDNHPDTFSIGALGYDLTLLAGPSGNVSPLWSLQWEVLFSLLLVLYLSVGRVVPPPVLVVVGSIACGAGVFTDNRVVLYMSMFAIGTGLALAWDWLTIAVEAAERRLGRALSGVTAVVAALAALALQLLPVFGIGSPTRSWAALTTVVTMLAIAVAIVLVGLSAPVRAVFENPVMLWLGLVSYPLYLIHEPIILAFAYATRADPLFQLTGLLLCFPAAHAIYLVAEKPAIRLSRTLNRRRPFGDSGAGDDLETSAVVNRA